MHPFPTYVHVLEGTLTVEFEMALASPLKGFLEAVNSWHNVKDLGETPLRFLQSSQAKRQNQIL